MPKLQRLRTRAFHAQHGRCHYCGIVMWLHSPGELPQPHHSVRARMCTAEHLLARRDGGQDTAENVAAACLQCNLRRHRRKQVPAPETYRALVLRRIAKGKWWPIELARALGANHSPS